MYHDREYRKESEKGCKMLSISSKAIYGLGAMVFLASRDGVGPVQARDISERQGIPQKFLEQLLIDLKKAKLVLSFRGAQGGYILGRPASDISVREILECLEGPLALTAVAPSCKQLLFFWEDVQSKIAAVFETSLADLLLLQQKNQKMLTYHI